jgi:leukotriene-A4 hydrolase
MRLNIKMSGLLLLLNILILGNAEAKKRSKSSDEAEFHSYANLHEIKTTHLDWKANIDFKKKEIRAVANWHIEQIKRTSKLIMDVNSLQIDSVKSGKRKLNWNYKPLNDLLGGPLTIDITPSDKVISIYYKTKASGRALQWLTPAQTANKKSPYLFTQCQAIMARSIIPCFDVPAQRFTYAADVQTPKGMMALMSADNPKIKSASGKYHFDMKIPIPSYLFALAVGDIAYQGFDKKCGVYAEPNVLRKAAKELEDMPKMIEAAEKLAGPYGWGRYDVLILPPSFPFGGMENPKLTFATPTILAGDKSLVNLIAHELAHSWSGNTVTNANWDELWINEGFTTYFERRITEATTSKDYVDMLWELSYQDLVADVQDYGAEHPYTALKVNLNNEDPDESFSNVPYEKGAHLLKLMEQTIGRKDFDIFLLKYFKDNAFQPMTTDVLLSYMNDNLFQKDLSVMDKIKLNDWIFKPGIPDNIPRVDRVKFNNIDNLCLQLNKSYTNAKEVLSKPLINWSTNESLYFLRKITETTNADQMKALDKAFLFTDITNSEIAFQWYFMALKHKYEPTYPKIEVFLNTVGRTKFVRPLYKEMLKGDTEMQARAKRIFASAEKMYHPATVKIIKGIFAGV